ncbi:aspartyl-trna synthetase [Pseudorhodoplanes sinuspersici]|uniref:Aspartyl-trna synthetase n=2 Tax=Pseudorhodoplanes sinuspersici TaxID=1235591 RepID=A0A1W6ZMM4_9HYPH|nr:aspartyl-trna synthetase [Pseudorhodoplanes sinuspersici]
MMRRMIISAPIIAVGLLAGNTFASDVGRTTSLPIPRFVSVKSKPANVRVGPGVSYPLKWTFVRRGLPVEIIAEFGNWRRIRDWGGEEGWIVGSLLSGNRTALVAPWSGANPVAIRSDAAENASTVAIVQSKVLVRVVGCDGKWCKVKAKGRRGYIRQTRLWGAYPGEVF